jgi:hypothetical protein
MERDSGHAAWQPGLAAHEAEADHTSVPTTTVNHVNPSSDSSPKADSHSSSVCFTEILERFLVLEESGAGMATQSIEAAPACSAWTR